MSIRDEEIKRMEQYAKGLGLKVEFRQHRKGDASAELISFKGISEKIIMYLWDRKSKTQIVMDFIHELAHHLAWIHNDRKDHPRLIEALLAEDARGPDDPPISKDLRKLIYQCEKKDAEFRFVVAHEVGVKISDKKLQLDKDLDIWLYKWYYLHGDFPNRPRTRKKRKQLKKSYGSKV